MSSSDCFGTTLTLWFSYDDLDQHVLAACCHQKNCVSCENCATGGNEVSTRGRFESSYSYVAKSFRCYEACCGGCAGCPLLKSFVGGGQADRHQTASSRASRSSTDPLHPHYHYSFHGSSANSAFQSSAGSECEALLLRAGGGFAHVAAVPLHAGLSVHVGAVFGHFERLVCFAHLVRRTA